MADSRHHLDLIELSGGDRYLATGRSAIVAAEASSSRAICLDPGVFPKPSAQPARSNGHGPIYACASNGSELLGTAKGIALAGHRVAVMMEAAELDATMTEMKAVVSDLVPLVVYAMTGTRASRNAARAQGSGALQRCGQLGPFQIHPRDLQEAVDMVFIARKVSERSLIPGTVAIDAEQIGFVPREFVLPDSDQIDTYLGQPKQPEACPFPGQRLIFGEHRPHMPRWFSLNRPVASGWALTPTDRRLAELGRRLFFQDHLIACAQSAMQEWAALTGRSRGMIHPFEVTDADTIVVVPGRHVPSVERAVETLRRTQRQKLGMLGIVWTHPFPLEQVRSALSKAKRVIVFDRIPEGRTGDAPLTRDVVHALAGLTCQVLTVDTGDLALSEDDAITAIGRVHERSASRRSFSLARSVTTAASDFPKADWVDQEVARDYPDIASATIELGDAIPSLPDVKATAFYIRPSHWRDCHLVSLSRSLKGDADHRLSGWVRPAGSDWVEGILVASPKALNLAPHVAAANVVLISDLDLPRELNPLDRLQQGGTAVIASTLGAEAIATLIPPAWQTIAADKQIGFVLFPGQGKDLLPHAADILSQLGREESEFGLERFSPRYAAEPSPVPPHFLAHIDASPQYDNIPKFWSEVLQPRVEGHLPAPKPNPGLALARVPSSTAGFADHGRQREWLPKPVPEQGEVTADQWLACPDSAFGVGVVPTEVLLVTIADLIRTDLAEGEEVFDKFKRSIKNLAKKIDGMLAKSKAQTLADATVDEASVWLLDKMGIAETDRAKYDEIVTKIRRKLDGLPVFVTDPHFHQPEAAQKGSGELLLVFVNPTACKGCGLCAENSGGIRMVPQDAALVRSLAEQWRVFENLPDTSGKTLARVSQGLPNHPLASLSLSRHCALAMGPATGGQPGSGARLALRLVTGVAEFTCQTRAQTLADRVARQEEALQEKIRASLNTAIPVDDLSALEDILEQMPANRSAFSDVIAKLDASGRASSLDGRNLKHLARMAQEMRQLHWELTQGPSGFGRARFGTVLAGEEPLDDAVFPFNPFQVPALADGSGGLDAIAGLMTGVVATHVDEMAALRLAEAALKSSPSAALEDPALQHLTWDDLTAEERAFCPPVLAFVTGDVLSDRGMAGLFRLLDRNWPIKLIILNELDLTSPGLPASALALSRPRTFVAATSIAHPSHFGRVLQDALTRSAPAVVDVYVPLPERHGFPAQATLAQARAAVACHLHPLFAFDPEGEGVFGTKITVAEAEETGSATSLDEAATAFFNWARAQGRYQSWITQAQPDAALPPHAHLRDWLAGDAESRAETTATWTDENGATFLIAPPLAQAALNAMEHEQRLRELAGLESPFVARVRATVEQEVQAEYASKVAELEAAHQQQLRAIADEQRQAQATQLANRLLHLAGLAAQSAEKKPGEKS